jgi:hypothetical protein
MPLHFISENTGTPYLRFMSQKDRWEMSTEVSGEHEPVKMDSAIIIDIENLVLGWMFLKSGHSKDWIPWPKVTGEGAAAKPNEEYKMGFSVICYSKKQFGKDAPIREFSSNAVGSKEFIKHLYDYAEENKKFGQGKVPLLKILPATEIKFNKGSSAIPQYEIVEWVDRPDELSGDVPPPEEKVAPPVSPAEKSGGAPNVDFNSEEI